LITLACIYCGQPSGGVDRAKNDYGYTVLNSVPCCSACNFMKRLLSAPDYLSNCARVVSHSATYEIFKTRWIETRTGGPDCQFTSTTATVVPELPSLTNAIQ
jgi:hypothetical protein